MKLVMALCTGLAAAIIVVAALNASGNNGRAIRIGTPSDTAGLLAGMVVEESDVAGLTLVGGIETFTINDCCTPVAQWAMTSESVDLTLMCPDSARALVEKDDRFTIVGPILYNAEVLVSRPNTEILSAGVAQGRTRQTPLIRAALGTDTVISPMLPSSLPFAYEKGVVDSVAVDFFTALALSGRTHPLTPSDKDSVSYVLVVRKNIMNTPEYSRIIKAFAVAAQKSNDPALFREAVEKHKNISLNDSEVLLWQTMRVHFASPINTPTNSPRS